MPQFQDASTVKNALIWAFEVDGVILLLMEEILHQLRLVVFPTIYRVSYIPDGAGFQPSTVSYSFIYCVCVFV